MMADSGSTEATTGQLTGENSQTPHSWILPQETPIDIKINGQTYAIMLATPLDLEDFALGFCLSEGLVKNSQAIIGMVAKQLKHGFEVDVELSDEALDRFNIIDKRRNMAGASGCGICGLTSLSHIVEPLPKIQSDLLVSVNAFIKAKKQLSNFTPLYNQSRSVHAAAFADVGGNILYAKEDVGRHNALDKLIGTLSKNQQDFGQGFIILTSRFAFELAQKSARMGFAVVVSISAPTSMAVELATKTNMTFAAFSGGSELMVFSEIDRICLKPVD
ncbi:MAG: formate dehydrogenase accessory sulfurtransferase FdhD [Rhizobiales bacterium]|nr:formate dehydrogenase accessory sulfurtransferase FdhD [Hyphomicrobiales bacterium]NRB13266.1 formate dehydrogenase accessory sulfurtransferase FdhD [Hyphomicrobiales bacterium]